MSTTTVTLIRHGETEWNRTGRLTGREDMPLTPEGAATATRLHARFGLRSFALVLVSPAIRARRTCELAGLAERAEVDADLLEWDYGVHTGRTMADVRREHPAWDVFDDGCPGGETRLDVERRARRVLDRIAAVSGDVALVGHGHQLRVLAALWLGLDGSHARHLAFGNARFGVLGRQHRDPVLLAWNVDP